MALTNAQILAPPGGAANLGAVKAGANITISSDGTISRDSGSGVNSIIAGSNISVDQSTGVVTLTWTGSGGGAGEDDFAPGTQLVFAQAAAPTGWIKATSTDDATLRLSSGTGGTTGGSTNFSTAFVSTSISGNVSSPVSWSGTTQQTNVVPTGSASNLVNTNSGGFSIGRSELGNHRHTADGSFDRAGNFGVIPTGGNFGVGVGRLTSNNLSSNAHTHTIQVSPSLTSGGGGNHNHSFSVTGSTSGSATGSTLALGVKYKDSIICTKQ